MLFRWATTALVSKDKKKKQTGVHFPDQDHARGENQAYARIQSNCIESDTE